MPASMLKSKKKSLPSTDGGSRGNTPKTSSSDATSRLTPSPLNKTGDSISEDEFLYGPNLSSPALVSSLDVRGRDSPSASSIESVGTGDGGTEPSQDTVFQSPKSSRTKPSADNEASTDNDGHGPNTEPLSQVDMLSSSLYPISLPLSSLPTSLPGLFSLSLSLSIGLETTSKYDTESIKHLHFLMLELYFTRSTFTAFTKYPLDYLVHLN